jgi:carbamoyl-phosphate synthase small subunit
MTVREGALVLSDGETFEGELFGADPDGGVVSGEVVFNTTMTGYQEVISDPSYAGQIITFTTTHLGNYGTTPVDDESRRPFCRGVVLREMARRRSNWRSTEDLDAYLRRHGVSAIGGVDTRRLTRHLRDHGSLPGAFGDADVATLRAKAEAEPGTTGADLVTQVTVAEGYDHGDGSRRVVAIDCGIKTTILRNLAGIATVRVVPAGTTAEEILALGADGVFLSNGPGDPAAVTQVIGTIEELLGRVPVFGICMGHQLLASALGGSTFKLPFGHHGGNHPVRDETTGKVEITAQNHNYCVDLEGVRGVEVTHVNLNDQTLEGFRCTDVPAFGIQYHPEAGPGPHDSHYLFDRFAELIDGGVG